MKMSIFNKADIDVAYLQEKLLAADSDDGGRRDASNCEIEIGLKTQRNERRGTRNERLTARQVLCCSNHARPKP